MNAPGNTALFQLSASMFLNFRLIAYVWWCPSRVYLAGEPLGRVVSGTDRTGKGPGPIQASIVRFYNLRNAVSPVYRLPYSGGLLARPRTVDQMNAHNPGQTVPVQRPME